MIYVKPLVKNKTKQNSYTKQIINIDKKNNELFFYKGTPIESITKVSSDSNSNSNEKNTTLLLKILISNNNCK